MFKYKNTLVFLDKEWNPIITLKETAIPRTGEKVYFAKLLTYYSILEVIHNYNFSTHIILIVEKFEQKN
jgi:hypothetical protein